MSFVIFALSFACKRVWLAWSLWEPASDDEVFISPAGSESLYKLAVNFFIIECFYIVVVDSFWEMVF